jgi:hypothetical protein
MNTFTAQELADFYQKVADGGEIEYLDSSKEREWLDAFGGPDIECNRDQWRIKPTKKIIDLSVLTEHAKEDHSRCWKEKDIVSLIWEHAGITHPKPKKKVINLSALINGIDCEFKDLENDSWVIGKLHDLPADHDGDFKYWKRHDNSGCWYDKCQPRMNHKHAWQGGECPIEGFVVHVWVAKDSNVLTVNTSSNSINWSSVIFVEFLEREDGYVMPWESE